MTTEGIPKNLKVGVLPDIEEQPSSLGASYRGLTRIIHEQAVLDTDLAGAVGGNVQRASEGAGLARPHEIVHEFAIENVQVCRPRIPHQNVNGTAAGHQRPALVSLE